MRPRMKRTCDGCKALETSEQNCQLLHPITVQGRWPHYLYSPAEECEKPLTIKLLVAIMLEKHKEAK